MSHKSEPMESRDKIKAAGLKATPQRRLVYEAMQKLCHASIDDIIASVQAVEPHITISTVYRIIESFCEANLISRFNHPNGKSYFDINPHEHHHIFTHAGDIVDVEDDELSRIIRERLQDRIDDKQTIKRISIQITTTEK